MKFNLQFDMCYDIISKANKFSLIINMKGRCKMKHVKTISNDSFSQARKNAGCGECQTSCQSACKTSCTVANQPCENEALKSKKKK